MQNLFDRIKSELIDITSGKAYLKSLMVDSFPLVIYSFAMNIILTLNFHYVGKLGDQYMLAGVGLGNTWIWATNSAIIVGLNIGTLTLCSQALGAKEYRIAGLTLHRAIAMRFLAFIPCYFLLYISESVFLLWGADQRIATYASQYCRYQFIPLICMIIFDTTKSLLLANGIFMPFLYMQVCMTAVHWMACSYLTPSLGVMGVCYAMMASSLLSVLLLAVYVKWKKPCKESFFKPCRESIQAIIPQLRQELPIGSTFYLDVMAFEGSVIIAGQFPPNELSAQVVSWNVIGTTFLPILGLMMSLTSALGNAMGEKNFIKAKNFRNAGILYALIVITLESPCIHIFRESIIAIYTNDIEVVTTALPLVSFFAFCIFGDFMQATNLTILKAIGKEKLAFKINFFSNYCLGLPIGYIFGVVFGLHDIGLWIGICTGLYFGFFVSVWALFTTDMKEQVEIIQERLNEKRGLDEKLIQETEPAIEMITYA